MIDCEHQWNSGKDTRFCLKCGQVRTFPLGEDSGKVVWQGLDDKRIPTELTSEEKNIIAHLANELGVKDAAECLSIPMTILRAWQGSYLRKPKIDLTVELNKDDAEPVVAKRKYNMTQRSPKSLKSPLSTEVNESEQVSTKVGNGNLLPAFPTFNDNWEAPVQLEWLVTYLELAKLGQ